jgi:GNAT superfamily N-acetyltransferase
MNNNSNTSIELMIRPGVAADTDAVAGCVKDAFSIYIELIGRPPAPMLLDFPAVIAAGQAWVADLDGKVVGALIQYETEEGFYIDTVAVLPAFQGKKIGRALLVFAEDEARRQGYDSLYLCTNVKMSANQVLYPKIGYVKYDKKLDQGYDRIFYRKQL